MTNYDQVIYPGYAYPQTSPAYIGGLASAYGVAAIGIEQARVLEIGCASGANILPLAVRFPKAEFVGVDLSTRQIQMARVIAKELSLKNVTFMDCSVIDLPKMGLTFDYIIAHGFYSWVPKSIQKEAMAACAQMLNKTGVLYMSYNVLPGWRGTQVVRDIMLYAAKETVEPYERLEQAKSYVEALSDCIAPFHGPYGEMMKVEINKVMTKDGNYVLHDQMGEQNNPCYFHDFMENADRAGLAYLNEIDFPAHNRARQHPPIASKIAQITDRTEQEQFLDFADNRRYRSSLLVHKNVNFQQDITLENLKSVRFIINCKVQPLNDRQDQISFITTKRYSLKGQLQGRIICTCLIELYTRQPKRLSREEVIEAVTQRLEQTTQETVAKEFDNYLPELIKTGILTPSLDPSCPSLIISDTPQAFSLARLQAKSTLEVTNLYHEMVKLNEEQRQQLLEMNGKTSLKDLNKRFPTFENNASFFVNTALVEA